MKLISFYLQEKYRIKKQKKYAPRVLLRRPFARRLISCFVTFSSGFKWLIVSSSINFVSHAHRVGVRLQSNDLYRYTKTKKSCHISIVDYKLKLCLAKYIFPVLKSHARNMNPDWFRVAYHEVIYIFFMLFIFFDHFIFMFYPFPLQHLWSILQEACWENWVSILHLVMTNYCS